LTPRLRAELDGVIVTLEGMRKVASDTVENCFGRPISKNSVFDLLSERRLTEIQVETVSIVFPGKKHFGRNPEQRKK